MNAAISTDYEIPSSGETALVAAIIHQAIHDLSPYVPEKLNNPAARAEWRSRLQDFNSSVEFLFHSQKFEWMASNLGIDIIAVRERVVSILLENRAKLGCESLMPDTAYTMSTRIAEAIGIEPDPCIRRSRERGHERGSR